VPAEANTAMGKLRRLKLIHDISLPPATDKCLLSSAYIEAALAMVPASSWMSLPSTWKLQDVQAALNAVLSLGTLGTSAFARYYCSLGREKLFKAKTFCSCRFLVSTPLVKLSIQ
jgi:hypothetical protein